MNIDTGFFRSVVPSSLFSYLLTVVASATLIAQEPASPIMPADNAVDQNTITARLKWLSAGTDDKLYFGTDNPPTNICNGTVVPRKLVNTARLKSSTTYYWRVVPGGLDSLKDDMPVWSFTTVGRGTYTNLQGEYGAVRNGIGYFQAGDGTKISAVDIRTFQSLWDYSFTDLYDVTPLIEQKRDGSWIIVELERSKARVRALYLSDGSEAWTSTGSIRNGFGLGFSIYTSKSGEKYIIVPGLEAVAAVSLEDGSTKWIVSAPNKYYGSVPAVDQENGWVYSICDYMVTKIDAERGTILRRTTGMSGMAPHGNVMLINDSHGYYVATPWWQTGIAVFNADLQLVWKYNNPFVERLTAMAYHDGKLFLANSGGWLQPEYNMNLTRDWKHVQAFAIESGSTIWDCSLKQFNYANIHEMVYCNGSVYCNTDNTVFAMNRYYFRFNAETGAIEDTLNYGSLATVCANPLISAGMFIEDAIPIRLGTGQPTDWLTQYGVPQLNHNAAPDSAITSPSKMSVVNYGPSERVYFPSQRSVVTMNSYSFVRFVLDTKNPVQLDWTSDNGGTWNPITTLEEGTPNGFVTVNWLTPEFPVAACRIRVAETGGTRSVVSAPFAIIPPLLKADPEKVDFGLTANEGAMTRTISLWNTEGRHITIYSMKTGLPDFTATAASAASGSIVDSLTITVTFSTDYPAAYIDTLTVFTNIGTLRIPLAVSISPAAQVDGSTSAIPTTHVLLQNYPNPFNPSTTIGYGLPYESAVSLEVYNALGERVATVDQGLRSAGYHFITWRPSGASGVYFYRLLARNASDPSQTHALTRKMLVLH